jgi:hypothetical protein
MDDIIVFSDTFDNHLIHLEQVFEHLTAAGMFVKLSKCSFCKEKMQYLGHLLTPSGISPDPSKITTVENAQTPTSAQDIRRFLGLAGYYRRFIKDFASIASPLSDLTRKSAAFVWTTDCAAAFDKLKTALTTAPVLVMPNFKAPFILHTDASNVAIGAVLAQTDDHGRERAISYASRTLSPAERNYSTVEREGLSVTYWVKYYRQYLHGAHFTIVTDHAALTQLFTSKDVTGRIARWVMSLQGFDYTIKHRPGTQHLNADAMTRPPVAALVLAVTITDHTSDKLYQAQRIDQWSAPRIAYLETDSLPDDSSAAVIKSDCNTLFIDPKDKRLYHAPSASAKRNRRNACLYVPLAAREEIMGLAHDDILGMHLGIKRTHEKIATAYWWPKLYENVKAYVTSCDSCQRRKLGPSSGEPLHSLSVSAVFERIGLDILGPLPETSAGNRYVVIFIDYLTKWVEAFATATTTAEYIGDLLVRHIICRYGAPAELLTDCGPQFTSDLFKRINGILNIKKTYSSPYHPQTNGLVERFNATLADMLSHFSGSRNKDWDLFLDLALAAYRRTPQASTGESPHFLLFGRDPIEPYHVSHKLPASDSISVPEWITDLTRAWKLALHNIEAAQQVQQQHYNSKRRCTIFTPGDRVYVRIPVIDTGDSHKFSDRWTGPFRIIDVKGKGTYEVINMANPKDIRIVNVIRLKPAHTWLPLTDTPVTTTPVTPISVTPTPATPIAVTPTPATPIDVISTSDTSTAATSDEPSDDNIYEIVSIDDEMFDDTINERRYLVRWLGYRGRDATSWERESNINAPRLISEYKSRTAMKVTNKAKRRGLRQV